MQAELYGIAQVSPGYDAYRLNHVLLLIIMEKVLENSSPLSHRLIVI